VTAKVYGSNFNPPTPLKVISESGVPYQ